MIDYFSFSFHKMYWLKNTSYLKFFYEQPNSHNYRHCRCVSADTTIVKIDVVNIINIIVVRKDHCYVWAMYAGSQSEQNKKENHHLGD